MQQLAENVQGIIVPNLRHWIPEEQPEFVIDQPFSFFTRCLPFQFQSKVLEFFCNTIEINIFHLFNQNFKKNVFA